MSVENAPAPAAWLFEESPTVDLRHRFDDDADPSEITVFPVDADDVTTAWITASVEDAVALEDAR